MVVGPDRDEGEREEALSGSRHIEGLPRGVRGWARFEVAAVTAA